MKQQIAKVLGREPTKDELDGAMRGWSNATRMRHALQNAGLSLQHQRDALMANVPELMRTVLANIGTTRYTDAEFRQLCLELIEVGTSGGMQPAIELISTFVAKRAKL